jgi:hypothetical protein
MGELKYLKESYEKIERQKFGNLNLITYFYHPRERRIKK